MAKLEVNNLTLAYGKTTVIDTMSFSVNRGEMLGLIGPNGSGKSTLIKAISHVIAPRSGFITIDGRDVSVTHRSELARLLGVVPQTPILPSSFSAFEIVLMGRNPHLGLFQSEGRRDWNLVIQAMEKTASIIHQPPSLRQDLKLPWMTLLNALTPSFPRLLVFRLLVVMWWS